MNTKKVVYIFLLLIMAIFQLALPFPAYAACSGIVYVNASLGSGSPDGCSWGTAFSKLQDGLATATSGDQIWVASGTYYPDEGTGQTANARNSTFLLKNSVAIYGGFTGSETLLSQRNVNPATNNTILSGDIDGTPADNAGNAYHIVTANSSSSNAVLDAFTIISGNATGATLPNGAGILISDSSPTFGNLIIRNNVADFGGGVLNYTTNLAVPEASYSRPIFTNVTFSNNTAIEGGGLQASNSSIVLNDVIFSENSATSGAGGGIYANTGNPWDAPSVPKLTNVTFSGNTARGGAGMYNNNNTAALNSVTFSNNTALRRGGGVLNENADPSFTNVTFYGNVSQESIGSTPWGGGGMINITSNPTLNNVTFSGNNSVNALSDAGGDGMRNTVNSNPVIRNSIFWGDTNDEINDDGTGTITISDSVVQGGFVGGTHIITTNPNLSALVDNGGFTQTVAIGSGSSALDAGGVTAACAPTDQRRMARPQGAACDIGAYEFSLVNTDVYIGINKRQSYDLNNTTTISDHYPNVFNGPLQVLSKMEEKFFATERTTYGNSFHETTGIPNNQLTTDYWFPWYDFSIMSTWISVGNPSTSQTANVSVYIGGQFMESSTVPPQGRWTPSYPGVFDGPVEVKSTDVLETAGIPSNVAGIPIVVSERTLYGQNFNETNGIPNNRLASDYWFPWYDYAIMSTWISVGNPSPTQTAHVSVYIGGQFKESSDIGPSDRWTPSYPGEFNGPVQVKSTDVLETTGGQSNTPGISIIATERTLYGMSFNETPGIRFADLTTDYWLPTYDSSGSMQTWLSVGNPSTTQSANVSVYIAGQFVGSHVVPASGKWTPIYPGTLSGPVEVKSTDVLETAGGQSNTPGIPVFFSARTLRGTSFSETNGISANQLDSQYWFPWYDFQIMQTWLHIGRP